MGRYVGLISGTSGDGIDAAVVVTDGLQARCEAYRCYPYAGALGEAIQDALSRGRELQADAIQELDHSIGGAFADAALAVVAAAGLDMDAVDAIGSHGQTLLHDADSVPIRSLQVGDPQLIADRTGRVTVGDFRSADIAEGGQGAPLAPAFHAAALGDGVARGVLNLGGISNLTVIEPGRPVRGFDIGPANTLMDAWYRSHRDGDYDAAGSWAASGQVDDGLLSRLLTDPYFAAAPPKSTGRDTFTLGWLRDRDLSGVAPVDVQATLAALTVASVADHVRRYAPAATEIVCCGGGVHNDHLMASLATASPVPVRSAAELGLDPDAVEACTFAWLAARTLAGLPGNLPEVTGARRAVVLGRVFKPGP